MNEYEYLITQGLTPSKKSLIYQPFDGIECELVPYESTWNELESLQVKLSCKQYFLVLDSVFNDREFSEKYARRVCVKDLSGTLGTALCFVEQTDQCNMSTIIMSPHKFTLETFCNAITTTSSLTNYMYKDGIGPCLAIFDNLWVHLFVCWYQRYSVDNTLESLNEDFMQPHLRAWHLNSAVDDKIITYFFNICDKFRGEGVTGNGVRTL